MKRPLLLTATAVLFAWLNVATFAWLRAAGSLSGALIHFWTSARADWLLVAVLTDAVVFAVLGLVWLWHDAGDRGWSTARRIAWLAAILALGSPPLLLYVALHGRASVIVPHSDND